MEAQNQYCTFYVDDLFLGVEVVRVQEVLRFQEMTHVPKAPAAVDGLINLRGQIVPAIDLRTCLGLSPREPGVRPMNVVIRLEEGCCSLLVDEIGDVVEVDAEGFEAPPQNLKSNARGLIQGVCKLEDSLLLILDTEAALTLDVVIA